MNRKPSQNAVGRALGLSSAAIVKLRKQGMPVDSVEAAQAWREARQNVAARKPAPAGVAGHPWRIVHAGQQDQDAPLQPEAVEPRDEDHQAARTRREIAEADLAEMRAAEERGELIRVAAVKSALARVFTTTRDALLQIPARLAPQLAADSDPTSVQNLLHTEIHQTLQDLAGASDRIGRPVGGIE